MSYLEDQKIIHRDLALRNLLVSKGGSGEYIVKVGDFGMSKLMQEEYYRTESKVMPVKWTAPEVLQYGTLSHKVPYLFYYCRKLSNGEQNKELQFMGITPLLFSLLYIE